MPSDLVSVTAMWQASCDRCGWHSAPSEPESAVWEWARLHRVICPLRPAPLPLASSHLNYATGGNTLGPEDDG